MSGFFARFESERDGLALVSLLLMVWDAKFGSDKKITTADVRQMLTELKTAGK